MSYRPMPYEIDPGLCRNLVELQAPTPSRDSIGDSLNSWSTVAKAWANVSPVTGREPWYGQQIQADVTHAVTLRLRPDVPVGPEWRVLWGGKVLNVSGVIDVGGRGRWWVLTCIEYLVPQA